MTVSYQKSPSWLSVLLVVFILVGIIGLVPAQFLRAAKANARSKALANSKTIVGGLLIFKSERGTYPCDQSRKLLEKEEGIDFLPKGKSANAYLAQLIAIDTIDSEKAFYAPGTEGMREGDNKKDTAKTLLAPGENSFAYIMAPKGEALTDISSRTPLIVAPVKHPGIVPIFDAKAYGGIFVRGNVDGSAQTGKLNDHGNALSKGRIHFFQTGKDSLFGTDFPIVTFPLKP